MNKTDYGRLQALAAADRPWNTSVKKIDPGAPPRRCRNCGVVVAVRRFAIGPDVGDQCEQCWSKFLKMRSNLRNGVPRP